MDNDGSQAQSPSPSVAAELLMALGAAADELDKPKAVALALDAVAEGRIDVANLYTQVLGPYLFAIGSRWQHGTERVWQEHFASHVVRTIIEALYPTVAALSSTVAQRGESVLLVCPPGEEHELGVRMLSDRFDLAGYRAIFLGADTPVAEIVGAGQTVGATIVAMSVSTVLERVELRCLVDGVREGLPDARIMLGGPAFAGSPSQWDGIDLLDPAKLGLPGTPPTG
jgi:MerR family transcriptional regulator, light-induced transcriptional regulator